MNEPVPAAKTKTRRAAQRRLPNTAKESPPPVVDESSMSEPHKIAHLHDNMSGPRTILLMRTLAMFLVQEGYDFNI